MVLTVGEQSEKAMEQAIWRCFNKQQTGQAIAICKRMNEMYRNSTMAWLTASELFMRLNNPVSALKAAELSLAINDKNIDGIIQKANCLVSLNREVEAGETIDALEQKGLNNHYQYSLLALVLQKLNRHEQAVTYFKKACILQPENSGHYYNLATSYRFLGQLSSAEDCLDRALALNPSDADAHYLRSNLRSQTLACNHVAVLKNQLHLGQESRRDEIKLRYALAKELEDLGEYNQSFQNLRIASDLRREGIHYTPENDLNTIAAIRKVFNAQVFERDVLENKVFDRRQVGDSSAEPIFIVGMPRTGTTLVERILSSHSSVFAAGELNNFASEMMRLVRRQNGAKSLSRERLVEMTRSLDFSALGAAYLASTRHLTGDTPHFIDKLPLNHLYVGLIHLALPNAKIIHVRRHPMDSCYAVYKTPFQDPYPFSYTQQELGQYYLAYHQLMAHWDEVLPGVIHQIEYEQLVADPEGESRRLIEFCGLEWEADCLSFYNNRTASTTASASQIRQPIYSTSIGKWRYYADQLQPLVEMFTEAGLAINN